MDNDQGRIYFTTGIDNSRLTADAARSQQILRGIGQEAVTQGNAMDSMLKKLAAGFGALFALNQVKDFVGKILEVRGQIEGLEISFRTLLGNKEKADRMIGEIKQFAVSTPMQMKDLAAGAQQMLAFNIETEKVMPALRALGDISMGDSQKFQSLTLAFSQMSATGKLMGQDLLQMINAGFNPLGEIALKTGKSIGELKDEMSKGAISAEMVQEAFLSATAEGGKFHGMLESQSKSIRGAFSNLQGAIDDMLNNIGQSIQPVVTGATNALMGLVNNYDLLLGVVGTAVATLGAYKAATMLNVAAEKAATTAHAERIAAIETELGAVGVKTAQERLAVDAELASAVAKGRLTQAEALHILSLKEEAAARVRALQVAAQQAAAEARSAAMASRAAMERLRASEINRTAMAVEYQAALAKGEVFEIAVAKERLETAQSQINAASQQYQAAATAETAAAKKASTAAATANAAATQLDTVSTQADTAAKGVLATMTERLTAATRKLWATLTAHPFALVIAAVGALIVAYRAATAREREMAATTDAANKAAAGATSEIAKETAELDKLQQRLAATKQGTEAWQAAKKTIVDKYGQYFAGLDTEIDKVGNLSTAYKTLEKNIRRTAVARAMEKYESDKGNAVFDDRQGSLSDIQEALARSVPDEEMRRYLMGHIAQWMQGDESQWTERMKRRLIPLLRQVKVGSYNVYQLMQTRRREYSIFNEGRRAIAEQNGLSLEEYEGTAKTDESPAKAEPWRKQVEQTRKDIKDAEAEVKRLEADANSTVEAVTAAKSRLEALKKHLKDDLNVNDSAASRTAAQGAKTEDSNSRMLEREASQRAAATETYTKKMAEDARASELAIRSARIAAMRDGLDKELAQVQLTYDRLTLENDRRAAGMLDDLAEAMIRRQEDDDPLKFKRKTKGGKWEDNPDARDKALKEVRLRLTVADLDPGQREQLQAYADIASRTLADGNAAALDKMIEQYGGYLQRRALLEKEWRQREDSLYATDADGNRTLRPGVTQAMADNVRRDGETALARLDETFAQREDTYQSWCDTLTDKTLGQLVEMIDRIDSLLEDAASGAGDEDDVARLRAQRNRLNEQRKKLEASKRDAGEAGDEEKQRRSLQEWEALYRVLQDCQKGFDDLGEAIGGAVGEAVKAAGDIAANAMQMINGIEQVVNFTGKSLQTTAEGTSKALQAMEKASIILAIVSAAARVAASIINLFNHDNRKQKEIEALQGRIDQLQWELDNADTMRLEVRNGSSLDILNRALSETRQAFADARYSASNFYRLVYGSSARASKDAALMAATVKKVADAYANAAYTADKALGEERFKDSRKELENIAQQQLLIQEQIDLERSKKKTDKDKIIDMEQKIEELGHKAVSLINDIVEDVIGGSATDIAKQLSDAFFDAFENGKSYAAAWGDKVNDIVADIMRRMMVQKFLEDRIGTIFDQYKARWFSNGNFLGIDAVVSTMASFTDDLNAVGSEWVAVWESLPDQLKDMMTTTEQKRTGVSKGIAQASQDSVDELNGRMTAIQGLTADIAQNTQRLLDNTASILRSVVNIDHETEGMNTRLQRVEGDLRGVRVTLEDIAFKGVKIKN